MTRIIPHKLVVSFSPEGEAVSAVLQYRKEIDGAVRNEFFTMSVDAAIGKGVLQGALTAAKSHVEKGEKL